MPIGRRAFTMVELLVVLAIIGILMGLLMPALGRARARANETRCASNLRELGRGLQMYRDDAEAGGGQGMHAHAGWLFDEPPRLTDLYPNYIADRRVFLCSADRSEGAEGGKPPLAGNQYTELDEPNSTFPATANDLPMSYMYEFSGAAVSWDWVNYVTLPPEGQGNPNAFVDRDGHPEHTSWAEVKYSQMRYGDTFWNAEDLTRQTPYPTTRFPALRCFWHMENPDSDQEESVLNVAFSGNVFKSTSQWETSAKGQ